ncbi:hypothetical protein BN130_1652 [Cronobacter malonaticus 507]|nr:hypothetical protein BN130_1652 [Cronobacter malonaticus 507]
MVKRQHLFRRFHETNTLAHRQAPGFKLLQTFHMAARQLAAFQQPDAITEKCQRTFGRYARIELTQRACRRVARVSENFPTRAPGFFVNFFKTRLRQKHFTAHFEARRNVVTAKLQRNGANGAHVKRDIFAGSAVAASGGAYQQPIFIQQADRQAVEFQFAAVHQRIGAFQAILYPLVERQETRLVKHVIQREHRHFMPHLAELGQRRGANALGGRIGRHQFRMRLFQRAQLAHQAIVFGIRHFRRVHNVVEKFMMAKRGSQLSQFFFD